MQLQHEFTVPVPVQHAWDVLLDVERVAPCMPGATVESVEGDSFTGKVKVKVGPITVAYAGSASFREKDAEARRVVVEAKGKETRGAGTAAATVTAQLAQADGGTKVAVTTDLAITGRPAQFGRGVMDDVGNKLLGQFADCLADQLSAGEAPAEPTPEGAGEPIGAARSAETAAPERPTSDTINLAQVAGGSVARRFGPAIAVIGIIIVVALVLLLT
ncbi:MAG TPA: SRPBCC family protein [Jiangellaceae bacterium]